MPRPSTPPHVVHLTSLDQLRGAAAAWDDLWLRSDLTVPTARAEPVSQWVEHFSSQSAFRAVVVDVGGRWVAALPLAESRVFHLLRVGTLPVNSWVSGGFLLDTDCDVPHVLDRLAAGLRQLPWRVLCFDEAPLDTVSWNALAAAFARAGMPMSVQERYHSAWLDIDHDWDAYTRRWSRNFRKENDRLARQLAKEGEVCFQAQSCFDGPTLDAWLRRAVELEDRGWKGRQGTSILKQGMLPFFLRQATELAQQGQLNLAFLNFAGRPIAFTYAVVSKGVYHAYKIGFDEEFAKYRPGHLLNHELFHRLWQDATCHAVDFMGEATDAQHHWKPTQMLRVGRALISAGGMLGRSIVHAHRHWWPHLRCLKHRLSRSPATASR